MTNTPKRYFEPLTWVVAAVCGTLGAAATSIFGTVIGPASWQSRFLLMTVLQLLCGGLIIWLVGTKLKSDPRSAKFAAVCLAVVAAVDWIMHIISIFPFWTGAIPFSRIPYFITNSYLINDFLIMAGLYMTAISITGMDAREEKGSNPRAALAKTRDAEDVSDQIKKLGELHAANVLTDAEFENKKQELLKKI
jgi:hypothetical protein